MSALGLADGTLSADGEGSDEGQTRVRRGSDEGQTRVRPRTVCYPEFRIAASRGVKKRLLATALRLPGHHDMVAAGRCMHGKHYWG
jgi:hypothetical protein